MKRLIILDYANAKVHFYNVEDDVGIDERYLGSIGFKETESSYMLCESPEIVFHKRPLGNGDK